MLPAGDVSVAVSFMGTPTGLESCSVAATTIQSDVVPVAVSVGPETSPPKVPMFVAFVQVFDAAHVPPLLLPELLPELPPELLPELLPEPPPEPLPELPPELDEPLEEPLLDEPRASRDPSVVLASSPPGPR